MSLESASFVSTLDASNPTATDARNQGDDHLRLLKTVLQATFPGANRAFPIPTTVAKTANYTVLSTDQNTTILVDTTSGEVTLTLPTLTSGDAGWRCDVLKTNSGTSACFIVPASGTLQSGEISGLSRTRRCIPGHVTTILWTGTAWILTRVPRLPLGTTINNFQASLPVGYEYANGQTLSSASTKYPDFYSANGSSGVVPDLRGRTEFGSDTNGTTAASRLTSAASGVDGATLGAVGGAQTVTLDATMIPSHTHTFVGDALAAHRHFEFYNDVTDTAALPTATTKVSVIFNGGGSAYGRSSGDATIGLTSATSAGTPTGTNSNTGGGLAHNNMPPAIVCNKLIVVE